MIRPGSVPQHRRGLVVQVSVHLCIRKMSIVLALCQQVACSNKLIFFNALTKGISSISYRCAEVEEEEEEEVELTKPENSSVFETL